MANGTDSPHAAEVNRDFAQKVGGYAHMLSMAQWLSPQELEASQAQLAFKLLQHARRTTPFYRDRLDIDLGSPTRIRERWRDIPILTRAQAIQNRMKLISRKPPRDMGPVSEDQTSGSAGIPFVFKKNGAMDVVSTALTERMFAWWSMDGRKSLAQISASADRSREGQITYGWHSRHPDGIK